MPFTGKDILTREQLEIVILTLILNVLLILTKKGY